MSFTATTDNIKTTLEDDPTLAAWVAATFPGKSLTVLKAFKNRQEVNAADLPIIMIVRPGRKAITGVIGGRDRESTVVLYLGFYCEDRESTQDKLVEFEEQVDDALFRNRTCGGTAKSINYESSANDFGAYHPYYFTAMQFSVQKSS